MQGWARVSRLMSGSLVEEDQRASQSVSKTQTCWQRQQSQAVGQSGLMLGRRVGGQVAGDEVGGVREGGLLQLGVPRRIHIGREGLNARSHNQHGSCAVNPKP